MTGHEGQQPAGLRELRAVTLGPNPLFPAPVGPPEGMISVGTLSGDPFISDTDDDYEGWSSPSPSRSVSVELTFTYVSPAFARMVLGSAKRVPVFWPRMKHRAARRRAGYTRTGRRR